jgi:hypothetical protein
VYVVPKSKDQRRPGLPNGIFDPKIPIWIYFGGPWNGTCWHFLWPLGTFYGHLVYYEAIWYIMGPFGILWGHLVYYGAIWYIMGPFGILWGHLVYFFPLWYCAEKNLAALVSTVPLNWCLRLKRFIQPLQAPAPHFPTLYKKRVNSQKSGGKNATIFSGHANACVDSLNQGDWISL